MPLPPELVELVVIPLDELVPPLVELVVVLEELVPPLVEELDTPDELVPPLVELDVDAGQSADPPGGQGELSGQRQALL